MMWQKDHIPINSSEHYNIKDTAPPGIGVVTSTLTIDSVTEEDEGTFSCYRFLQLNSATLQLNSSRLQLSSSLLQLNSSRLQLNSSVLQLNSSRLQLNSSLLQLNSSLLQLNSSITRMAAGANMKT